MKVKEEKMLIGLSIISILIVFFAGLIQVADDKLSDYNKNLLDQQMKLNILVGRLIHASNNNYWHYNFAILSDVFKIKFKIEPDSSLEMKPTIFTNTNRVNSVRSKLWEQVKQKKLRIEDYYYEMATIYQNEYVKMYDLYHKEAQEYKQDLLSGTSLKLLKSIFFVSELILLLINLFGFAYLYLKIKLRV